MSLKVVSPAVIDHVTGIWVKQLRQRLDETDERLWRCPTFPYEIVSIEQVSPTREVLEVFEGRRNELDKRLGRGAKLETIHGFYCPSSMEVLNQILRDGFYQTFSGELTFSTDAPQAIHESLTARPINKLILARVSLGWKDADYTEINNKYKIKNLRGVIPGFVITFRNIGESQPVPYTPPPTSNYVELDLNIKPTNATSPRSENSYSSPRSEPTYSSPRSEPTYSSPPTSPVYTAPPPESPSSSARLPKYMRELERSLE